MLIGVITTICGKEYKLLSSLLCNFLKPYIASYLLRMRNYIGLTHVTFPRRRNSLVIITIFSLLHNVQIGSGAYSFLG
jgi:hypothetical protein